MINELIERLLLDTENISTELDKSNSSNSINEVLNKILAYEDLTEDELNIFKSISLNNPDLTNEEKETLEFIEFLISVGECIEDFQINLLNKLLNKYKSEDTSLINAKYERNKRLVDALQSNDLFADYDHLLDVLKQYNYSNKDILIILKGLITSNYKDYDKSKIVREEKVETKKTVEIQNIFDVMNQKNVTNILRKYGFHSNDINKKYLELLPIEDNMFNDIEYVLEYFKKLDFKPKALYKEAPKDFIFTIAFATKEHIDTIDKLAAEKGINIKKLIKNGKIVLNSDRELEVNGDLEYFGLYDSLLKNIELYDSLGYKHSRNNCIELYYMRHDLAFNCYKLFSNEYRFRLKNPQDLEYIISNNTMNFIDRHLEFERGRELLLDSTFFNQYLPTMCKATVYGTKIQLEKANVNEKHHREMSELFDAMQIRVGLKNGLGMFDVDIPEFEETKFEKELYKHFDVMKDSDGIKSYVIPLEYMVDHSLEENEYIKYLDENYRQGKYVYLVGENTRVSRIKVLRILTMFKDKGIEINEETVKFAMRFDLIGFQNDIDNINNSLNDFQNERAKKLC